MSICVICVLQRFSSSSCFTRSLKVFSARMIHSAQLPSYGETLNFKLLHLYEDCTQQKSQKKNQIKKTYLEIALTDSSCFAPATLGYQSPAKSFCLHENRIQTITKIIRPQFSKQGFCRVLPHNTFVHEGQALNILFLQNSLSPWDSQTQCSNNTQQHAVSTGKKQTNKPNRSNPQKH